MCKFVSEYRINKKGAECFRSDSLELVNKKLEELRSKKPNVVFTVQSRTCRLDRFGVKDRDWRGRPAWSIWQ